MNIYEKLMNIQSELKAPKGQYNSFGKYKYRSCEDILEAAKPICRKFNTVLVLTDDVIHLGDRFYIVAIATLYDVETGEKIVNQAQAREEETKKGMDASQITGTASSYARKYALNGLFNIDDTKDADTDEFKKQEEKPEPKIDKNTMDLIVELASKYAEIKNGDADELLKHYMKKFKVTDIEDLTYTHGVLIGKELSKLIERSKQQ